MVLPVCKKERGRFIDVDRGVCEGPPTLYKNVLFSLCGSCSCTRNKGHRAVCVNCGDPPPRSVCSAQSLVQQREAKHRLFGQTVHVPRAAQTPAAPALVGAARGNGGGDNRRGNRWGRGNRTTPNNGGASNNGPNTPYDALDISAKPMPDGTFILVGKGKAAKELAKANNDRRAAERAADASTCLANGGHGQPGSATDPKKPTRSAADLQKVIAILEEDGQPADRFKEELAQLQRDTAAPKQHEVTYAKAKRLAEEASKRLDKAVGIQKSAEVQLQTAKEDVAVAALALREAKATQGRLFESEKAVNAEARSTKICVDKIILGESIEFDFGELMLAVQGAELEE